MVCKIERPSPQALFDRYLAMFSANVLGGAPVIPESNEWYVVANDYAAGEEYYAIAEQLFKERDPRYACCENLLAMAANNGVFPRPASFAEGYIKLTGTPGADLPFRLEVVVTNGGNYVSVGSIPNELDATGSAVVRVRSITPGSVANSDGKFVSGTLVTSIPNVDRTVIICGGNLCGGAEAEDCEAFRLRYIARRGYQPRATAAWMIDKLLEWPCATRVLQRAGSCCECEGCTECDECANCGNRLEFYVMFDGSFPCGIPTANIVEDINLWMFGERPGHGQGQMEIGVCGSIHLPIAVPVDIRIDTDGCPTASQIKQAETNVRELFALFAPSQEIKKLQVTLAVADVIGADKDIEIIFDIADADLAHLDTSQCGDLAPHCDYLPCLGSITWTAATALNRNGCD